MLPEPLRQLSFTGRPVSLSRDGHFPPAAQHGHSIVFFCSPCIWIHCLALPSPTPWFWNLPVQPTSPWASIGCYGKILSLREQAQRKTTLSKSLPDQWHYVSLILWGTLAFHFSHFWHGDTAHNQVAVLLDTSVSFLVVQKVTVHLTNDGVLDSVRYDNLTTNTDVYWALSGSRSKGWAGPGN